MPTLPRRLLAGVALAALNACLALAAFGAPSSIIAQAEPTPDAPAIYRVTARTPGGAGGEAAWLMANGYDVLEAREDDDLFVMAEPAAAAALQAAGFAVALHSPPADADAPAPFTYYGGYRTVAEHYAHLDAVAAAYPHLARVIDYGDSWRKVTNVPNGHDLKAICITERRDGDCALTPETDKPRFFLIAATHARELSTSEMAWRYIDLLVDGYATNADIAALLEHNEIWIVPVVNPDGRTIVESGGNAPRLQRKNANDTQGNCSVPPTSGNQHGVDLNRNGSFKWGVSGYSTAPCSAVYLGDDPASEPEGYFLEALMADLFRDQRGPLDADAAPITTTGSMLTLHSFANQVLLPWGWTECNGALCPPDRRAPNDAGLRAWGYRQSYYNGYPTGQSSELLYAASGVTDDWAYGVLGIPGATYEIGPNSGTCGGGFTPPYSCQDSLFWPLNRGALLYAAKLTRQPYALSLGPNTLSVTVSSGSVMTGTLVTVTASINDAALGPSGFGKPASQPISAAELYVDAPPWAGGVAITMTAQDGAFNTAAEVARVALDTTALGVGRHTLFARGRDAAGNWGPTTSAWLVVLGDKRVFTPIVER